MQEQLNNPLHGKRLDDIIESLVSHYKGWEGLGQQINIKCFNEKPNMKSSLAFLRKTPWARTKVEQLYVRIMNKQLKKNL